MVRSAWASELDDGRSQHRYMDGDSKKHNMSPAKATKKTNYLAPTAAPPMPAYAGGGHFGDVDLLSTHTNTRNSATNMKTSKNALSTDCHVPTPTLSKPAYPGAFTSSEVDFSSGRGITNTINDKRNVNTAKNGKGSIYNEPTAVSTVVGYPSAVQSRGIDYLAPTAASPMPAYAGGGHFGDADLLSTHTNTKNTAKNMRTSKNALSTDCHVPTPANPAYPGALTSSEVDFSSSRGITDTINDKRNVNTVKNGKGSIYNEPTAVSTVVGYPSAVQSSGIDSSSTASSINTRTGTSNVNGTKNGKKSSYQVPSEAPSMERYPIAFPAREADSRSSPTHTNTIDSTNNSAYPPTSAKTGKSSAYPSSPEAAALPGYRTMPAYRNALQSRENGMSPSRTNADRMNDKTTRNKGKNERYGRSASGLENEAYPGSFQYGDVQSGSKPIASAWEEHIDEYTNRKYFYNSITGQSSWGEPNATVKKAPPPPPSPPPISIVVQKREQDYWFKIVNKRGRRMWYNEVTNVAQVERPDCLRKYK